MNKGSEGRRALLATTLGAALGLIAVLFSRRDGTKRQTPKEGSGWRGRSAS
jgi:hypothetical protein